MISKGGTVRKSAQKQSTNAVIISHEEEFLNK